jgi:hypothetical protein
MDVVSQARLKALFALQDAYREGYTIDVHVEGEELVVNVFAAAPAADAAGAAAEANAAGAAEATANAAGAAEAAGATANAAGAAEAAEATANAAGAAGAAANAAGATANAAGAAANAAGAAANAAGAAANAAGAAANAAGATANAAGATANAAGAAENAPLSIENELDLLALAEPSAVIPNNAELRALAKDIGVAPKPLLNTTSEKAITLSEEEKLALPAALSPEDRELAEQIHLKYKQLLHRVRKIPSIELATSNALTTEDINEMLVSYNKLSNVTYGKNEQGIVVYPYVAEYDDLVRIVVKTYMLFLLTQNLKSEVLKGFMPISSQTYSFTFKKSLRFILPVVAGFSANTAELARSIKTNIRPPSE